MQLLTIIQQKQSHANNAFISHLSSKQIIKHIPYQRQQILKQRKKQLMQQLKNVHKQLTFIHKQQLILPKYQKSNIDNPQLYAKANLFVKEMNQKRKQLQQIRNKKYQALQLSVQKSLNTFKQINRAKEQQQLVKRLIIEERIQKRRQNVIQKLKIHRSSNHLIQQIKDYRVSIPIINTELPFQTIQRNPKSQANKYHKSIFLQNIQKEDLMRKRQQYIKNNQKKIIRQRQIEYSSLIKNKIRKNYNNLFLT